MSLFLRQFISSARHATGLSKVNLFALGQMFRYSSSKASEEACRSQTDPWDDIENAMFHNTQSQDVKVPGDIKKKIKQPKKNLVEKAMPRKPQRSFSREVVDDPELGQILKLGRDDPMIDQLMLSVTSTKFRDTEQILILEGRRLINEALLCELQMKTLLFSKSEQVKLILPQIVNSKAKLIKTANHNLKFWSQLTTSPGLLGIFKRPLDMNALIEKRNPNTLPITIICDNIREPNNLGALIRVAAAAGCHQIILTKGCTAPWESKAIRGSSGAHFRIKIIGPIDWSQIDDIIDPDSKIFIANNNYGEGRKVVNYEDVPIDSNQMKVLIVGSEAHGISEEAEALFNQRLAKSSHTGSFVNIPLAEGIDSLNVVSATAVILFEIRKKLLEQMKGV